MAPPPFGYGKVRWQLDQEATRIWNEVTFARRHPKAFSFGEVGVTEHLHLNLLMLGCMSGITVVPTDETTTGADWEWVIELTGGSTTQVSDSSKDSREPEREESEAALS